MRLSEAIRLGATMNPQTFGQLKSKTDGGTCAVAAALEAVGLTFNESEAVFEKWPLLRGSAVSCPVVPCFRSIRSNVEATIVHLNDYHRWTRERIADWVERQEGVPEPETTAVEADVLP